MLESNTNENKLNTYCSNSTCRIYERTLRMQAGFNVRIMMVLQEWVDSLFIKLKVEESFGKRFLEILLLLLDGVELGMNFFINKQNFMKLRIPHYLHTGNIFVSFDFL